VKGTGRGLIQGTFPAYYCRKLWTLVRRANILAEILSMHPPISNYPSKWDGLSDISYYFTFSLCWKPSSQAQDGLPLLYSRRRLVTLIYTYIRDCSLMSTQITKEKSTALQPLEIKPMHIWNYLRNY